MPDPDKCLRQMDRISVTATRHGPQGEDDFPKRSGCDDRTRNSAAQFVQGWSECIFAELCKTERKRETLSQSVGRSPGDTEALEHCGWTGSAIAVYRYSRLRPRLNTSLLATQPFDQRLNPRRKRATMTNHGEVRIAYLQRGNVQPNQFSTRQQIVQ